MRNLKAHKLLSRVLKEVYNDEIPMVTSKLLPTFISNLLNHKTFTSHLNTPEVVQMKMFFLAIVKTRKSNLQTMAKFLMEILNVVPTTFLLVCFVCLKESTFEPRNIVFHFSCFHS